MDQNRQLEQHPNQWNIQTYRSRVGDGSGHSSLNPTWGTARDTFVFRLALPVHRPHGDGVEAVRDDLYSSVFHGPPTVLQCTIFSKSKVRTHPFMGQTRIDLSNLSQSHPVDTTARLTGVDSGTLRVRVSLKFELMARVSRTSAIPKVSQIQCCMYVLD